MSPIDPDVEAPRKSPLLADQSATGSLYSRGEARPEAINKLPECAVESCGSPITVPLLLSPYWDFPSVISKTPRLPACLLLIYALTWNWSRLKPNGILHADVSFNDIPLSHCGPFGIGSPAKADQRSSGLIHSDSLLTKTHCVPYFITVKSEFTRVIQPQNPNPMHESH